MRASVRAIVEKWAQQAWLPGMEAEEGAAEHRLQDQTRFERDIETYQHIQDSHPGPGMGLWMQQGFTPESNRRKAWDHWRPEDHARPPIPEADPGAYRIPHPSKFPNLDINTISYMFWTQGNNGDTSGQVLQTYNQFKEVYEEYYEVYLQAGKLLKEGMRAVEVEEELKNLTLKQFLHAIVDFLIGQVKVGIGELFKNLNISGRAPFAAPRLEKKFFIDDIEDTTEEMRDELRRYNIGLNFLNGLDTQVRKKMWEVIEKEPLSTYIEKIDRRGGDIKTDIISNILRRAKRSGARWDVESWGIDCLMRSITNTSHRLENPNDWIHSHLSKFITQPLEEGVESHQRSAWQQYYTLFRNGRTKTIEETQKKINDAVEQVIHLDTWGRDGRDTNIKPNDENVAAIEKVYAEVKEILSEYIDLNTIEKMFNFGMLSDSHFGTFDKFKISPDKKLAFKMLIIKKFLGGKFSMAVNHGNSRDYEQKIYKILRTVSTPEALERNLEKLAAEQIKKSITDGLLQYISRINLINLQDIASWLHNQLRGTSFNGIEDAADKFGDFRPRVASKKLVAKLKKMGVPEDTAKTFVKLILKKGKYHTLIAWIKEIPPSIKILFYMLMRTNKLSVEKMYEAMKMSAVDPLTGEASVGSKLGDISHLMRGTDKEEVISHGIRSLETAEADGANVRDIVLSTHNNAGSLSRATLKRLLAHKNAVFTKSRDISKKFNDLIIKVLGQGGIKGFNEKYASVIKMAISRDLVKSDFRQRLAKVARIFLDNKEINPSKPNFPEVKRLILETSSDVDMVLKYQSFAQYYDRAKPKDPNLFKLDMDLSPKLRFRVLKDLDPYHFQVGDDTDCCQSPGGVGQSAMVDSFINAKAGILVLEAKKRGSVGNRSSKLFPLGAQR